MSKSSKTSRKTKPAKEKAAEKAAEKAPVKAPAPPNSRTIGALPPVPAIAEDLWPQGDDADYATLHAAEDVFNHLLARVKDFQATLPENYELGIQLANLGANKAMNVRGMGYRNPNIIEFYGLLDGKTQVAVVQHVSQLSFMLVAVPPVEAEKPYRIGFGADI